MFQVYQILNYHKMTLAMATDICGKEVSSWAKKVPKKGCTWIFFVNCFLQPDEWIAYSFAPYCYKLATVWDWLN
jgi:hypothetical protein